MMTTHSCKSNQVAAAAVTTEPKTVSLPELINTLLNMRCVVIHLMKSIFHHQKGALAAIHIHMGQTAVYIHRLAPRIC